MLRELHEVICELQSSVAPMTVAASAGLRIDGLELNLPLDMALVLRDGGCTLLADLPRNTADAAWERAPSRLHLTLQATPLAQEQA